MSCKFFENERGGWSILLPGQTKAIGNYPTLADAWRAARRNGVKPEDLTEITQKEEVA